MIETLPLAPPVPQPRTPNTPRPGGNDGFARLLEQPLPAPGPEPTRPEPTLEVVAVVVPDGFGVPEGGMEATSHVSTQSAITDSIARPWRLQGGWSLSYRNEVLQTGVTAVSPGHADARSAGSEGRASREPGGAMASMERLGLGGTFAAGGQLTAAVRARVVAQAVSGTSAESPVRPAALLTWPHRMLRWQASEGVSTAWVRDYTLDAGGATRLVEALRCQAHQEGIALHRIMLNGHAIWRDSHSL